MAHCKGAITSCDMNTCKDDVLLACMGNDHMSGEQKYNRFGTEGKHNGALPRHRHRHRHGDKDRYTNRHRHRLGPLENHYAR